MTSNVQLSLGNSKQSNGNSLLQCTKEDEKDYSVLQLFVENKHREIVRNLENWLISIARSKGIDVNNEDWLLLLERKHLMVWNLPHGVSEADFLRYSLAYKFKNILPFLFKCNGNINYTSEDDGQTILHHYPANHESYFDDFRFKEGPQIVKSLIDEGASVNAVNKSGKTPVHVAAENKKPELIKPMLNSFNNVAARDEHGNTVLHSIANASTDKDGSHIHECSEIVRILLSKGADPNVKNNEGLTPLQLAAIRFNNFLLQIFQEHGVNFSVQTKNGENLIFLVCKNCWLSSTDIRVIRTIRFLVKQGCNVNAENDKGYSPLHYAAQWHRAIKYLIELGADVNCQTKQDQQTPLHRATLDLKRRRNMRFCDGFRNEAVDALLRAGAYWDAVDCRGRTPLHYAIEMGNVGLLEKFLEYFADINDQYTSNLIMIGGKKLELQNAAFKHGVKLKAVDFPVAEIYKRHVDVYAKHDQQYYSDCVTEVDKLKTCTISDGVSVYRFLHMSSRRQLAFVEKLPQDLEEKFPLYNNLIQAVCRDSMRRNQLLEPAKSAWYEITGVDLPDICAERIFYFLNNWSLKALIDSASS